MSWTHQHSARSKAEAKVALDNCPGLPVEIADAVKAAVDHLRTDGAVLVVTSGTVMANGTTHADFKVSPHDGPEAGRGSGFTPA